jgi:hypothetical protein
VDKVLKRSDEQAARDMSDYRDDITKHAFYNRAQALTYFPAGASRTINMVDAILRFPDGNPSDQSLIVDGNALLKMLLDEIMDLLHQSNGQLPRYLSQTTSHCLYRRPIG